VRGLDIEAIHLREQLVERLFAFVIGVQPAASFGQRVNFIDKYDAGRALFGLGEESANARGPAPDQHLHEVTRTRNEKRQLGLTRHGTGDEGLPTSSGAVQQYTPWSAGTHRVVELRRAQGREHVSQRQLRIAADARHVVQSQGARLTLALSILLAPIQHGVHEIV
jgi:hypothetical protein